MTREAESERFEDAVLLALKMEEGYHQPINAGSLHKLEKQGDRFFLEKSVTIASSVYICPAAVIRRRKKTDMANKRVVRILPFPGCSFLPCKCCLMAVHPLFEFLDLPHHITALQSDCRQILVPH